MDYIPYVDLKQNKNFHPHVVILGAGASLAAFPKGDRNGNILPTLNNIVEIIGIAPYLKELGIHLPVNDFEAVFDELNKKYPNNTTFAKIKEQIYNYFSSLVLPDKLTLYDKLVLSLREQDIIATFNWDPLLGLAYQRNRHLKKLPNLAFLHGNVFVGYCKEHQTTGFINCACSKCLKRFEKVELLYPIKDKNYTENYFIKTEWDKLQFFLERAFMITIFGYSAPKTDIVARDAMYKVWGENKIRNFAEIQIIDIKSKTELKNNWSDFIVRNHYSVVNDFKKSLLNHYPRRTCEAWASAVLQNDPWGDIEQYNGNSLKKYQKWILNLIESEIQNELDGSPLSKW